MIDLYNRIQDYQTDKLKEYFEQDALLVPIETIRGKYYWTIMLLFNLELVTD